MWTKYFIADTSVQTKTKFGYCFAGFQDNKEPIFLTKPDNVKLYDKLEDAKEDLKLLDGKLALWQINIDNNRVSYGKIEEKSTPLTICKL